MLIQTDIYSSCNMDGSVNEFVMPFAPPEAGYQRRQTSRCSHAATGYTISPYCRAVTVLVERDNKPIGSKPLIV